MMRSSNQDLRRKLYSFQCFMNPFVYFKSRYRQNREAEFIVKVWKWEKGKPFFRFRKKKIARNSIRICSYDSVNGQLYRDVWLKWRVQCQCKVLVSLKIFRKLSSYFIRSQWPRGLRHELFSLAQTLGTWVSIPLEPWMSVCVCSLFVLGSGLATGWSLVQGVPPNVLD
jgi:hypothetical protein